MDIGQLWRSPNWHGDDRGWNQIDAGATGCKELVDEHAKVATRSARRTGEVVKCSKDALHWVAALAGWIGAAASR